MANRTKNVLTAENLVNVNMFRLTEDNQLIVDFNLIIAQPKTKEECDSKYYITEDSHVQPYTGREWFNWYKWNCENWGTQWNCEMLGIDGTDTVGFFTAWAAPFPIISKISEMLGDVELKHTFYDIDNFGSEEFYAIWRNGKMIKAFVSTFDWDTEEYNVPIEIDNDIRCRDFADSDETIGDLIVADTESVDHKELYDEVLAIVKSYYGK